uniref:F-box domain-containing protein n=1 Tax=Caenorhabditis tropicalis TaxID=1561998 RepID=A0A1I7UTL9_9PELO
MNLLRFPLVVLIEVFKNMDFREKFLFSLMSKRARNILELTSMSTHFSFDFTKDLLIHTGTYTSGSRPEMTVEASDYLIGGKVIRLSLHSDGVILQDKTPQNQSLLTDYLLDIFRKQSISVAFFYPTQPASALEFMQMINERKLFVESFSYFIMSPSSEFIPRILDECTEVTNSIYINAIFPDDFVYTPPRPFKVREFRVGLTSGWFNLESFMSCRRIIFERGDYSYRAPQSWNTFLRNWIDSDARLEYMLCSHTVGSDFPQIVDGLRNEEIQEMSDDWIDVKRRDGSEFVIGRSSTKDSFYIMTKEEHMECFKQDYKYLQF